MPVKSRSTIACIAGLTLSLQTPATAAVVISNDYYEQSTEYQFCSNSTNCRVNLAPIPADKRLDVSQVNCYVNTTQALRILTMGSSSALNGTTTRDVFLPFSLNSTVSNLNYYYVYQAVEYRAAASPYIFFTASTFADATIVIKCTVVGKLSPR